MPSLIVLMSEVVRVVWRLLGLSVHMLYGLYLVAYRYQRLGTLEWADVTRQWARTLLSILHVNLRTHGEVPPPDLYPANTLLISNHITWLDIVVLCNYSLPRFVGKKEVLHWPVLGWLSRQVGTLFIDRKNKSDSHRINELLASELSKGHCMAVFPEATTTDGRTMLPFKVSLFESVRRACGIVCPLVIQYHLPSGARADAVHYAGDRTFLQSLWYILRIQEIFADVAFVSSIHVDPAEHGDRIDLAILAHTRMAETLEALGWVPAPIERMVRLEKSQI